MGEANESFEDELVRLAKISEIIEESFISSDEVDIEIKLEEKKFRDLSKNLRYQNNEKLTITIDNVNFIFLKK